MNCTSPIHSNYSRHSSHRRKSSSPSRVCTSPSISSGVYIQALASITFSLKAKQEYHQTLYTIQVLDQESGIKWSYSRSFDAYRTFQKKLLDVMDCGHFCQAECPWLYNFTESHFPKPNVFLLLSSKESVIRHREQELSRYLNCIVQFLLNRTNHTCRIVRNAVAMEVATFFYGDILQKSILSKQLTMSTDTNSFSYTSEEEERSSVCEITTCNVCHETSEHQRNDSNWMTLTCGHMFHEECIIAKLNETLCCPTCGTDQSF